MSNKIKLTRLEREFLSRLANDVHPGPVVNRDEDRARQHVRKKGLARVVMNPRRWEITDAGIAALQEKDV